MKIVNTGNVHEPHNSGFQFMYQIYLSCSVGLKVIKS